MAERAVGVSRFRKMWEWIGTQEQGPSRVQRVLRLPYQELCHLVSGDGDSEVPYDLVTSLHSGDAWIIQGMFAPEFMRDLKRRTVAWTRSREPSFHKMLEGSPDFHRIIDPEAGRKYSFACCKHSAYFYRWNDDPLGIWPEITERWRVIKTLMGLAPDEYERNTPKDGVVDRIQVVRYPPSIGFLEPHADPHLHQRLFFSGYMSKRGVDYEGGGFYLVGPGDTVVDIEDQLEVGDACIGYATVMHGVAPCDRGKTPDWAADDGRWFLSMYSNASDEMKDRHTGHPVKLNLPGVLP